MQLILVLTTSIAALAHAGIITHDLEGHSGHHPRATSYQNINIEHYHPVPTYIKKEHKQLLEHPVSLGKSSSRVEIHHGGKHDHGYGIANVENSVHDHAYGGYGFQAEGGYGNGGHVSYEEASAGQQVGLDEHAALSGATSEGGEHAETGYQVDYSQLQGHGGLEGAELGHYQYAPEDYSGYQQQDSHQ